MFKIYVLRFKIYTLRFRICICLRNVSFCRKKCFWHCCAFGGFRFKIYITLCSAEWSFLFFNLHVYFKTYILFCTVFLVFFLCWFLSFVFYFLLFLWPSWVESKQQKQEKQQMKKKQKNVSVFWGGGGGQKFSPKMSPKPWMKQGLFCFPLFCWCCFVGPTTKTEPPPTTKRNQKHKKTGRVKLMWGWRAPHHPKPSKPLTTRKQHPPKHLSPQHFIYSVNTHVDLKPKRYLLFSFPHPVLLGFFGLDTQ